MFSYVDNVVVRY